jgi:O-antigen/teichoic acid export membrane protein
VSQTLLGPLASAAERFFATATERRRLAELLGALLRLVVAASVLSLVAGLVFVPILAASGGLHWAWLAATGCLFALISGWERILDGIQNAARARSLVAWHQALRQWLRPLVAVLLVGLFTRSGEVALAGFAAASAGVLFSQVLFARNLLSAALGALRRAEVGEEQARLLRYAGPFAAWGVFTWLQISSDRWALQLLSTSDAVGIYAVLLQLGIYPLTLVGMLLSQVGGPIVFARVGDGSDPIRLQQGFRVTLTLVASFVAISVCAISAAAVLHQPLFELLVAPAYRQSSPLLPLALAAGAAFNIGQLLCLLPLAAGNSKSLIVPKIGTALLSVPLYFAGAAQAGIQGVLVVNLFVSIVYLAWMGGIAAWTLPRVAR